MKTLNSPILAIILLGLFTWLAVESREPSASNFINDKVSSYDSSKSLTYAQTKAKRKANVLQDLWEVSDNEITKSVDLFGEHGERK